MTLLEQELRAMSVEQLRTLTRSENRGVAEAAQAALANRPKSQIDTLREVVFPPNLNR